MTKRIDKIEASIIREVFAKAATKKDLVNLSIGQPDFCVPEEIKSSMRDALICDKTQYTQSAGVAELKEKILAQYPSYNSVMVTPGASAGLFLAFSALFEEEDEVIVFDPYFVSYPNLLGFLGVKAVIVKSMDDFSLDVDALRSAVTSKTKGIIVNSPNNPSGYIYSREELETLVSIAKENNLHIVSDEVYSSFDYDGEFCSISELTDDAIIIDGYSKKYAMTGLRAGYAIGPESVINDMIKLQQFTFVCAPSIAQHALADSFDVPMVEQIKELKAKRDYVYTELQDFYDLEKSKGAFYAYVKLPKDVDSGEFCDKCLDNNLLVIPSAAFSVNTNAFRISFAVDWDTLEKGMEVLQSLAPKQNNKVKIY